MKKILILTFIVNLCSITAWAFDDCSVEQECGIDKSDCQCEVPARSAGGIATTYIFKNFKPNYHYECNFLNPNYNFEIKNVTYPQGTSHKWEPLNLAIPAHLTLETTKETSPITELRITFYVGARDIGPTRIRVGCHTKKSV